jgi:CDP-6-deoxy-D-xylo-4-hexulose-3-dehydrase
MQAALGVSQLTRIDEFADRRRENSRHLFAALEGVPGLILPRATAKSDPSWFGFPITLDPKSSVDREELLRFLEARRIGTRLMFAGNIVRQPAYRGVEFRIASSLEVADTVMRRTFWVGTYPGLTPEMLDYIAASIIEFVEKAS